LKFSLLGIFAAPTMATDLVSAPQELSLSTSS